MTPWSGSAVNGPLIVLLEQQRADQADDGVVNREDADNFCVPLDLAVEAFDWLGPMRLGPMWLGKGPVGEDVVLGLVHDGGEPGPFRPDPVGDVAPLLASGFRRACAKAVAMK
ncbi:hypothetical protein GGE07_001406 [Sinorhizobium terangae]|nr:hypothetical protein [Sinorhizobium terangae]